MEEIINESKRIAGTLELDLYATDEELKEMDFQEGKKEGLKEGMQKGIQKGIQQGIQQGIEQKTCEMVINMYNDNVPVETIAKYTNLTVSEISKIISSK